MAHVVSTERLGAGHTAYTIEAPEAAAKVSAGQLMLAQFSGSPGPLPHPVADFAREAGTITIVRPEASGGSAVTLESFSGPVGGTTAVEARKVLCAGEGVGVAALFPRLRELKAAGCYTIVVIAFKDKDAIYWQDRIDALADELYVVTDDASFGIKGPVQHTVKAICQSVADVERALMVLPLDTLRASLKFTIAQGIPTRVSLGAILEHVREGVPEDPAEGVGLVSFDWQNATDIDGQEIVFDKLTQRLGIPLRR